MRRIYPTATAPLPEQDSKDKKKDKSKPGWLGFFRRLIWAWWIWIAVASVAALVDHGNLAAVLAGVGFFFYLVAPRERVPSFGLEAKFPVTSLEFRSSVTGATGVPFIQGNNLSLLNNGDEFYPAMLEAIAKAQKTITMEAYIYWAGEVGKQFARAMAERGRAGVQVKLLLDAFGSATIGREVQSILKDSGCEIAWYNRVWLKTIGRFNHRNHRKSLIVDGRVAFTGGAGIADHWIGAAQGPKHWRDIQIRLEGPGAVGLQAAFAQN